jgi:hypothetical protein
VSDDLAALAADAYIYGFPLVFGLQMVGGQAEMGMIAPGPFNTFSHASRLAGLTTGADAAKQKMETALTAGGLAPVVNGWTLTFHSFDYNLDHLGPGTIDDPAWKISDRHASYLARALAARGGLWGNHAPAAPFRPLMRLYQPQAAILDGTYQLPPITKGAES